MTRRLVLVKIMKLTKCVTGDMVGIIHKSCELTTVKKENEFVKTQR